MSGGTKRHPDDEAGARQSERVKETPASRSDAAPPTGAPPDPGTPSLYERYKDALRRGHVAALRGRDDAAIDAYSEAASIAPDRSLPHASIGGVLGRMGRPAEAVAAYQRALKLAPRDEAALRGLSETLAGTGRATDAAGLLDRLAEVLESAARLPDAADAARRALELAESRARRRHLEALVARLQATAGSGDDVVERSLALALAVLDRATEARPIDPADLAADPADAEPRDPDATEDEAGATTAASSDEPVAEPAGLGIALGAAAEAHLHAGAFDEAHAGLLAAARSHRRAGRLVAALDACDLAIGIAPADPDLHLLLAELYLDRGWRQLATDKLLLLARVAELDGDDATRSRLREVIAGRLPDEPRLADIVA